MERPRQTRAQPERSCQAGARGWEVRGWEGRGGRGGGAAGLADAFEAVEEVDEGDEDDDEDGDPEGAGEPPGGCAGEQLTERSIAPSRL